MTAPAPDHLRRAQGACCARSSSAAASTPSPSAWPWPRPRNMGHAEFLELVLSDEVTRRETTSAALRARTAGLDPDMVPRELGRDHQGQLRPPGLGRAVLAALHRRRPQRHDHGTGRGRQDLHGHRPRPRRRAPALQRASSAAPTCCSKRLRASRLDNSHDAEIRKLIRVDLLILDDFALQPFDPLDTADIYELIVERHRAASTVVTSNREPIEWLAQMADALLAQSAIDRLQSAAYELVLDGESYRHRQKPGLDVGTTTPRTTRRRRRS